MLDSVSEIKATAFADLNEAEAALKPGQLIAVVSAGADRILFQPIDARNAEIGNNGAIALMGGHPRSWVCENNRMFALKYAEAGIPIFPVSGTARKPDGKLAKSPLVKWRDQSTTDTQTIIDWWRQWPDALIGIDMDKAGLVAVDADRHDPNKDGVEALKQLEVEHDVLPERPITRTAGDGEHHFFRQPGGEALTISSGALPPGIDVRGVGGYIIAPGSITGADGDWRTDADAPELIESFEADTIPVLPEWLAGIIRAPKVRTEPEAAPSAPEPRRDDGSRGRAYAQKALDENCAELAGLREGGRNNALNGVGFRMGRMIGAGWIDRGTVEAVAAVTDALTLVGRARGMAFLRVQLAAGPLPATEIERRAKAAGVTPSALRKGRNALGIKPQKIGRAWVWALPVES
jgi:hypothetical protein